MPCEKFSQLQYPLPNSKRQGSQRGKASILQTDRCCCIVQYIVKPLSYADFKMAPSAGHSCNLQDFFVPFHNRKHQLRYKMWVATRLFISVQIYYANRLNIKCLISKNLTQMYMLKQGNISDIAWGKLFPNGILHVDVSDQKTHYVKRNHSLHGV